MNSAGSIPLLPDLEAHTANTDWHETSGESGSRVFRLTHLTQPVRFLKISPREIQRDLRLERDKLIWLRNHLPVPQVPNGCNILKAIVNPIYLIVF